MRLPRGYLWVTRKRKDGSVHTFLQARVYKHDGGDKRKRISVYGQTLDKVKEKIRKLESRTIANFDAEKETLGSYLDKWLDVIKSTRARRTHELYAAIVKNHIKPFMGMMRLAQVKSKDIKHLLEHSLPNVGSRTRQLTYRVLHYAFATAIEDKPTAVNPCLKKDKPRHTPAEYKTLSTEEVVRFLEHAKSGDHYVLFFLALETGMRQGEILGLRWDAVDSDSGSLWVRVTLTRDENGNPVLSLPKASRKRRVEVSPILMAMLHEHRRAQYPLGPWVFADKDGQPLRKDDLVRKVYQPLLKAAGIERIRFHDLRHTSATLGLSSGDNVKIISERLGHSSAKMTLDVYAKAIPTLQRESAARMGSMLAGHGPTKRPTEEVGEA